MVGLKTKKTKSVRKPNGRRGARPLFDIHPLEQRIFLSAGHLAGAVSAPQSLINLTAEGTEDWSHWGDLSNTQPEYKAGDTMPVGFTPIGTPATLAAYSGNSNAFSWSNGAPDSSATADSTGVYSAGVGSGFQLVLPADTQTRVVDLYVGVFASAGTLTASLSDGSAATFGGFGSVGPFGCPFRRFRRNLFHWVRLGFPLLL